MNTQDESFHNDNDLDGFAASIKVVIVIGIV